MALRWNKNTVYYGVRMNLAGLHTSVYTLRYDSEMNVWLDKRKDFWTGPRFRNSRAHKLVRFNTMKEAQGAIRLAKMYRKHIQDII